jgi:hypothetical protein
MIWYCEEKSSSHFFLAFPNPSFIKLNSFTIESPIPEELSSFCNLEKYQIFCTGMLEEYFHYLLFEINILAPFRYLDLNYNVFFIIVFKRILN